MHGDIFDNSSHFPNFLLNTLLIRKQLNLTVNSIAFLSNRNQIPHLNPKSDTVNVVRNFNNSDHGRRRGRSRLGLAPSEKGLHRSALESIGGTRSAGDVREYVADPTLKKHRASSKLSNQKVFDGSLNKRQTLSPSSQASKNYQGGNLQSRCQVQSTKEDAGSCSHSNVYSGAKGSSSVVANRGNERLDKVVIDQETGPPDVLLCMSMKATTSEGEPKANQEVLIKENVDIVPKIKWGDLDNVSLSLTEGCGNSTKIAKAENLNGSDVVMQKHANVAYVDEPVTSASSCSPLQMGEVTSEDRESFPETLSSGVYDESTDGTWREGAEIPCEYLVLVNVNPHEAVNIKQTHDNQTDRDLCPNDAIVKSSLSLPVEEIEKMTLREPHDKSEDGALNVSEVSITNESTGMIDGLQDANLLPHLNDGVTISIDASTTEITDDPRGLHYDSTVGSDIGEGEQGESKERFRERLWCFLFENLNRAVDELYLLCELECDMEQMNEAILVLEEAASDFKELKCRVEHFENTKRNTSQSSKDNSSINVKNDHRRPHALSWEVRRMTTSPHRAEILSSSLEAFKKIQVERASKHDAKGLSDSLSLTQHNSRSSLRAPSRNREQRINSEKQRGASSTGQGSTKVEKLNVDASRQNRVGPMQNGRLPLQSHSTTAVGKSRRELAEQNSETEKQLSRKDIAFAESKADKQSKSMDNVKRHNSLSDKEKEKRSTAPWKSMDAWKEKRNWEDILKSPLRSSIRITHTPGIARRGMERGRVLHDKLMSPEKKKKTSLDLKREAEEKHARAMRIRSQLETERAQKLQRTSEKLNRVNEWQAVRSLKLREGMHARHQRSESRHEAYLAQVARRAGDESSKVNEVRFITSLNEENKKLMLRQKHHDSEMRRTEKLQVIRIKQKEDTAREEAVLERKKLLEAEKLQRLAETQRRKEEAQVRREEERKASSAAREAKALEQLRKKEFRARAQQEEAELLAQKLAERLRESEQRRKSYLEQIREKASMDFRDQSSPLLRRSLIKEGQSRSLSANSVEEFQTSCISGTADSSTGLVGTQQQSLKRRIKKIRQRLMALKYEFTEPPVVSESSGIGYRALVGTARAKIGRWLQDLQRLRQARKEGAASIGLIVSEMVKFLEGKDPELQASRQAGLLDFISSALPASHTSKPEACQVTVYLLRLLRVVLSVPANRSYFLAQNLLPPIIPMLSASLENYIKIAASSSIGCSNILTNKASTENLEAIAEVLDGFLWTVTIILGHARTDERQLQMLDGLLELIVSYQIVHRLRDLFALFDRPQVEGSPFPTSILLSLNLLAVLTSRPRTISSIDWEACISRAASENKVKETKSLESKDVCEVSVITNLPANAIEDLNVIESGKAEMSQSGMLSPSRIPDRRQLDGELIKESSIILDGQGNVETIRCGERETTIGEAQNIVLEEHANSVSPQKNEKNSADVCTERKRMDEQILHENKKVCRLKQPTAFLLSVIAETGLVGLPSLLTAVLLQANNRLSSEQASYILPSNFVEVATGVLKVLNNLALLDIVLLQRMLAKPDLKMELFHLMSFLLSYCTSKWRATNDKVGLLLLESLLLLGYFVLFHPGNQSVLRWGKSPTILHKVCDLPFVFFSDPELTPILGSTLVAACYGCDQNRGLVLQELSIDMLLSLLKSCRQVLLASPSNTSPPDTSDPCDGTQLALEARKLNRKVTRVAALGRGSGLANGVKMSKARNQRENRGTKNCDEWAVNHNQQFDSSHTFMLHQRFPTTFLDKAEEFFTSGISE